MLGEKERNIISNGFQVYDHNWEYYSLFLGEPFLIDDCLIYYDGRIVYICAFLLNNIKQVINANQIIAKIMSMDIFKNFEAIDIWGNFVFNESQINNEFLKIISYYPPQNDNCEFVIDVSNFSYDRFKKARLSRNACKNKGFDTNISNTEVLSYRHIQLIEQLIQSHDISNVHISFNTTITSLVKNSNSIVVEAYYANILEGFAVLMNAGNGRCVYTIACSNNNEKRASDCVMSKCIEYCQQNSFSIFHLGYSFTDSLLSFKQKWGAVSNNIPYGELFLAKTNCSNIIESIKNGKFLWQDRLHDIYNEV